MRQVPHFPNRFCFFMLSIWFLLIFLVFTHNVYALTSTVFDNFPEHLRMIPVSSSNDEKDMNKVYRENDSTYFQEGNFVVIRPSICDFQGDGPIYGWTWLQKKGDRVSWTFHLEDSSIDIHEAALNFTLLVTNRSNGGSGFSSCLQVRITDLNGKQLGTDTLCLTNTFRPQYSEYTVGIGYLTSGAIEMTLLKKLISRGESFAVTIEWSDSVHNQIAAKCDSVILAYIISLDKPRY